MRMTEDRWPKKIFEWKPKGIRKEAGQDNRETMVSGRQKFRIKIKFQLTKTYYFITQLSV